MVKLRERTSLFLIRASRTDSPATCASNAYGRGARWAEGPAWFAAARYLVWSDIPNNRIMRFVEPSGEVSVFRERSNNSSGNTVDNQGRLVTCEHLTRRVTPHREHRDQDRQYHALQRTGILLRRDDKTEEAYFRKIKRETLLRKARQAETVSRLRILTPFGVQH
jgi:hypothetical protein